jgi:hypothetical protein
MCMKINELSSYPRSNIGVEAGARDRSGFVPSAAPTIQPRARRAQLGAAPLLVGRIRNNHLSRQRTKSHDGKRALLKDVKNEGRSGNVYENKGPCDNLPDTKDDISARLHATLHKITRILQEPSAHLSLFERWRTNRLLQNVGNRKARDLTGFPMQITRWTDEPMNR